MSEQFVLGGWFPDVGGWGWDKIAGWAGGAVSDLTSGLFESLVGWISHAAGNAMLGVWGAMEASTAPDINSDWFGSNVWTSAQALGAYVLLAGFLFAIISSVLKGNPSEMLKAWIVDLPKAIAMMVFILGVTGWSLRLVDELSDWFMIQTLGQAGEDGPPGKQFFDGYAKALLATSSNGQTASFMLMISAFVALMAAMAVTAVLLARTAYIYVLLALSPIVAGLMLTSYRGAVRKLLETLFGVVLLKLVLVMVVTMGAAAMVNAPGIGENLLDDEYASLVAAPDEPGEEVSEDDAEAAAAAQSEDVTKLISRFMIGAVMLLLSLFTPAKLMAMIPSLDGAAGQAAQRGVIGGAAKSAPGVTTVKRAGTAAVYRQVQRSSAKKAGASGG